MIAAVSINTNSIIAAVIKSSDGFHGQQINGELFGDVLHSGLILLAASCSTVVAVEVVVVVVVVVIAGGCCCCCSL